MDEVCVSMPKDHRIQDPILSESALDAEQHFQLAYRYETSGLLDAAKSHYHLATRLSPTHVQAWYRQGLVFHQSAQIYLTQTLPNHITTLAHLTSAMLRTCHMAWQLLQPFIDYYLVLYKALLHCLEQLAQANIDNTFKSAIQYFYQAQACCQDLVFKQTIKTQLTEIVAQYGHALYKKGDYSSAQKYYLQAIKQDPDHLVAQNQMGMCLFKEGKYPEARAYFADIIGRTQHPQEQADAWLNISCSFMAQKNWPKAAATLRDAKRLAPQDPLILQKEKELVLKMIFTGSHGQRLFKNPTETRLKEALPELSPCFKR